MKIPTLVLTFILAHPAVFATVPVETELPASEIKTSASSVFSPPQDAVNLINGTGLNGDNHNDDSGAKTMWHTVEHPTASAIVGTSAPAWVRFDFAKPQTVDQILIWNHNQSGLTNRGFRKTRIYGTADGRQWKLLNDIELKQGGATAQIIPSETRTPLKAVVIAAESNWGGNVYGLSEVRFVASKNVREADLPFPTEMTCVPQAFYRNRPDGKAGREISVRISGAKLYGNASICVECDGKRETTSVPPNAKGTSEMTVLLPEGASVATECQATLTLQSGTRTLSKSVTVPAKRQWTIYLFPHSHVDIGYTNPQDVVENIHMRNLDVGMEIGKATASYPAGARHVWNNEVLWAVESWLKKATPERKQEFIEAVKMGQIGLSASYLNCNTTTASDEELIRFFAYARELRALTGAPVDTMCQFDIPGMSWGLVQAAARNGVRAILDFPNPSDRTGLIHTWRNKPFYWVASDGKTKVLYLQIFPYNLAWKLGAYALDPKPYVDAPGRDRVHFADAPDFDRRSEIGSFASFIANQTSGLERSDYPYDIIPFAWSLSDNCPVDVGLPDLVKRWNEKYAWPKLVIADASTIAAAFENRFGTVIPERRGDLTEYWTDGLGSDARRVGYNRLSKETLVQAETLATMLGKNPVSADETNAAWRWIQLGTEHTWGFMFPDAPIAKSIEATKASYFENARKSSETILAKTLPAAVANGATVTVFNTLEWPRSGIVTLPKHITALKDTPTQKLTTGESVFLAKDVPALGSKIYHVSSVTGPISPIEPIGPNTLENALVKITLDPATGDIASLMDKRSGHDFAMQNGPYALNSFRYLRGADSPDKASKPSEIKISIKENGPVLASLLVESKAEGCNKLTREVRILADQPQVEILNTLDKISTRNKEGIHFAFAFNLPDGATPRMDIPWGVMNPLTDQLDGANKNWLACQRWVDLSAADCGVTWVPIESSVFQFGGITANLLGSVNPNSWKKEIGDTRTIVSWALNNHWHTNFPLEQGGTIPFHFAILPHGTYDPVVVNRFGLEQNRPLLATSANVKAVENPLLTLDNPRVFISTLRPSQDGKATILRLRSLSDKPETVTLAFPSGEPKSVTLSGTNELPVKPITNDISLLPYGVTTVRIEPN